MVVDVASSKFSFGFAPGCSGNFSVQDRNGEDEMYPQNLCEEASNLATLKPVKVALGVTETRNLGHLLSSRSFKVPTDRVAAIGVVGFYSLFIPD